MSNSPSEEDIFRAVVSHTNGSIEKSSSQSSIGYVSRMSKCTAVRAYKMFSLSKPNYGIPHIRAVSKLCASLMQVQLTKKTIDSKTKAESSTGLGPAGDPSIRECSPKSELLMGSSHTLVVLRKKLGPQDTKVQEYFPRVVSNSIQKNEFLELERQWESRGKSLPNTLSSSTEGTIFRTGSGTQ